MPVAEAPQHADVSPEHGMPVQGDGAQNAGNGAPVTEDGQGDAARQASNPCQGSSRPVAASTPQPLQSWSYATPETLHKRAKPAAQKSMEHDSESDGDSATGSDSTGLDDDDEADVAWNLTLPATRELAGTESRVGDRQISKDPAKVEVVRNWPEPKTVREVRGFQGLVGFYQKFILNFATIAKPLTNILKSTEFEEKYGEPSKKQAPVTFGEAERKVF
eukprot:3388105-Rhodomonas_salina.1